MWFKKLVAAVLLSSSLAACGDESNTLKIGVGAPLTGPNAKTGQDLLNGVRLAVMEKNAQGGLHNKQVEVISGDDRSDPREGIVVANKMANSGVIGVIGHYNSGVSIPASAEVYNPMKIINISPASTNPVYTERGLKYIFRTVGRDDLQGKVAADFSIQKGWKKMAVIHNKGAYGQGLAEEFAKNVKAQGGSILIFDGINKDDKDFSPVLTKIKAMNPELLFYGGEYQDGALFTRQAKQVGITVPVMGGDALYDKDFVRLTGQEYAQGSLVTFAAGSQSTAFNKSFSEKFGEVGPFSAYAYDATNILFAAIAKAGPQATPEAIRDEVAKTKDFPGATGQIGFDAKGDLLRSGFIVWEVNASGDFVQANTSPAKTVVPAKKP